MAKNLSITRSDTGYMVIRWSAEAGEQGWKDGVWGRCEDAALMDHGAASDLAGAIAGAKVAHENEVFDCDDFDDE